jgi:hypothetical protein
MPSGPECQPVQRKVLRSSHVEAVHIHVHRTRLDVQEQNSVRYELIVRWIARLVGARRLDDFVRSAEPVVSRSPSVRRTRALP